MEPPELLLCRSFGRTLLILDDLLRQFLLHFHVGLTGDHDALSLRRACAVHGLRADSRRQPCPSSYSRSGAAGGNDLGRNGSHPEVLLDVIVGSRVMGTRPDGWESAMPPARSPCQTSDLIREAGDVLLADVRQQQVNEVVAALGLGAPETSSKCLRARLVQVVISISLSLT